MTNTVEALMALYVAKGGSLDDVAEITLIPDMIMALSELQEEQVQPVTHAEIDAIIDSIS